MSNNLKPIYSLSICGRLTLELHSLNNEGGEGNQTMTRTVVTWWITARQRAQGQRHQRRHVQAHPGRAFLSVGARAALTPLCWLPDLSRRSHLGRHKFYEQFAEHRLGDH
ncbi:MAG: hypothetical protein KatS3mg052_1813 [Candidatus Roseilinea sp.]|nr:MAG: hypothetical protein KatS3mg052_1813 [Candidatus Roseilinea sp.]